MCESVCMCVCVSCIELICWPFKAHRQVCPLAAMHLQRLLIYSISVYVVVIVVLWKLVWPSACLCVSVCALPCVCVCMEMVSYSRKPVALINMLSTYPWAKTSCRLSSGLIFHIVFTPVAFEVPYTQVFVSRESIILLLKKTLSM